MRFSLLASLGLLAVAPLVALACGGDTTSSGAPDGGGDGTSDVTTDTTLVPPDTYVPPSDASMKHCQLNDMTDPVALCTQKLVLRATHVAAFDATRGLATGWDSTTGALDTDGAGAVQHDLHDDLGYLSACGLYHTSSGAYGDTELTPTLDADAVALAPLVEQELATLPDEYSGETYARLRNAAGAARLANDSMDGDKLDTIAETYGRRIFSSYFFPVMEMIDAGPGEGGADAAPEAGPPDGGDAGAPIPDGILGRPSGAGAYAYAPADVATAALALLDLAQRNPTDPSQTSWQIAALGAFEHLHARARDPVTGLYYRALVTSNDPGHDQLDPAQTPSDVLLTDVTATVALALSRAADLVNVNAMILPIAANYPFNLRVDDALAAVNATPPLYDGDPDAGTAMSTGFMEGYVPSTQTLLSSKATRDNAYLLATLYRQGRMTGTRFLTELQPTMFTLIQQTLPMGSLLTATPGQNAYFHAVTRGFGVLGADAGETFPASYKTAAVVAFIEGINELFYMH